MQRIRFINLLFQQHCKLAEYADNAADAADFTEFQPVTSLVQEQSPGGVSFPQH
jgi:hypothetical protein